MARSDPPPARLDGCTVGRAAGRARLAVPVARLAVRPAVRPAVHGWPFRLAGRAGWPADRVFLAVHGWPADRVPGRTRLAAVHGWPTRLAGRPCSWPCTVGRPVGRPAVFLAVHGWPTRLAGPSRARLADPVGRPTVFLARLADPVGRPAVFLAMHGWPTRLAGRPCSWPCTVGRPGWPADRVPGRARLACTVDRFKIGMVTKKAIGNKGIRRVRVSCNGEAREEKREERKKKKTK